MNERTSAAAAPSTEAVDQVRVRVLPDGRLSRQDAAKYLGLNAKTLAMWGLAGKGPRSIKLGGRRFYFRAELDRFIREGAIGPGRGKGEQI